jgi:hypothetical protein
VLTVRAADRQGIEVVLAYNTTLDEGAGTEQYLWHMQDNRPVLLGYHGNSNDLIAN